LLVTVPTSQIAAQLAAVIAGQLAHLARVEPLDARALLLDSVRELFAMVRPMLADREPGGAGVRLCVLVRELEDTHRTLAVECEGELRRRAMAATPATRTPAWARGLGR
jgi:hypothetical protein